ncbi:MAG: hypothetical protein Q4G26_09235 [Paracoccus sp. (in: a-proteobacteria)]|nr:hypothetical protein [Paracoccus sp. (in: a-proteobacteria)]
MKMSFVVAAVLIAMLALVAWNRGEPTSIPAPVYRTPAPDLARIPQGPPTDPSLLPATPVAPWDASGVRGWMSRRLAELETEITDPEIRRLALAAAETAANATDESFYRASNSALPLYNDSDAPEDHLSALYILLKTATSGRDEPFTLMRIGVYLERYPLEDGGQFAPDAYRLAADRDFLPAIVNLAVLTAGLGGFPPDQMEAYLRYGFDLDATDGGWHIIYPLVDFYMFQQPYRDSGGYLHRAVDRYRQLGDEQGATETEYFMQRDAREVMPDPEAELAAAKRALAAGNIWIATNVGHIYMQNGPLYDRDLSRDYSLACLTGPEPVSTCAVNLGSLYTNYSQDSVDLPLAIALWKYAFDLDPGTRPDLLNTVARDMATRINELSPGELILTDRYLAAIRAGDYSRLPHVKDARPVPEMMVK